MELNKDQVLGAMKALKKIQKTNPQLYGGFVHEFEGKDWLCFTNKYMLLMMQLPVEHGLEKHKLIIFKDEILNKDKKKLNVEPINSDTVKINGIETAYGSDITLDLDNVLFEFGILCIDMYQRIDPEFLYQANKFMPDFWKTFPTVKEKNSKTSPLKWENENQIVMIMPLY